MKILKYMGFGMVILLSLGMVQQATSYTSAQVTNKASVSIVAESKNALIGIDVDGEVEINEEEEILIPFTVYNNMNRPITHMYISNPDRVEIEDGTQVISAGNNKNLRLKYTGEEPTSVTIEFHWAGGSATIEQSFTLNSVQINNLLKAIEETKEKKENEDKMRVEEELLNNMVPIEEDENVQEEQVEEENAVEKEEEKEEQKEEKKIKDIEEKTPVEKESKE